MFEELIRRELPKTVHELYDLARRYQPTDCGEAPCSHRDKHSPHDMEWQHQLRRELQELAVKVDEQRNGVWRLKI